MDIFVNCFEYINLNTIAFIQYLNIVILEMYYSLPVEMTKFKIITRTR